jgi:2'-5' RNA ligase
MIWVEGKPSQELSDLKKKLEDALLSADSGLQRVEERVMVPHITLARIKNEQWRQLPEKPEISEPFDFQISANSIEVMESELKRGGAEYTILESCELFEQEELGEE